MNRCVESWTRWGEFAEVFRFYRSGRFVHHIGIVEDRYEGGLNPGAAWSPEAEPPAPALRILRMESALCYLTEIYLFVSSLARRNVVGPEARIDVSLHGQTGRTAVFKGGPLLYGGEGVSRGLSIQLGASRVTAGRLRDGHDEMAVRDGLKLAEAYNVPEDGLGEAMREWQAGFYRRRF